MERRLQRSANYTKYKKRNFNIILLGIYLLIPVLLIYSMISVGDVYADEYVVESLVTNDLSKPIFHVNINDYQFGLNPIEINSEGDNHQLLTESSKVSQLLEEAEVEYDSDDIVIPKPDTVVAPGAKITVIKIFNERIEELASIPFNTIIKEDPNLPIGNNTVTQEGLNGQKLLVFTQKFEDGVFVSKTLVSEDEVYPPTDKIITKGTRREIPHSNLQSGTCDSWDAVIDGVTGDEGERTWLKSIMRCESGCNAGRVSRNGTYHGLFQFHPRTFASYGGDNIYDGNQQIPIVLAWVRAGVQYNQFPGCTRGL